MKSTLVRRPSAVVLAIAAFVAMTFGFIPSANASTGVASSVASSTSAASADTAVTEVGNESTSLKRAACDVRYDPKSNKAEDLYSMSGLAVRLNANQSWHWTSHVWDGLTHLPGVVNYHSTVLPAPRTKHNVNWITGYIIDGNNGFLVDCNMWGSV